jgi:hypothetical protein
LAANSERVVVQSDSGNIPYRMIACEDQTLSAEACHDREQRRLNHRIFEKWIAVAVKIHSVALTGNESAYVERKLAVEEQHFVAAAAQFHALAVAALDIRRGKSRAEVLPILEKQGIKAEHLDWEVKHLSTVKQAERAAATNYLEASRESGRTAFAQPFIIEHLKAIVKTRSAKQQISFEAAEEAFWAEIAQAMQMRIIDPAFAMPEKKEILVSQ